ncbi:EAL and HDOD domain-containing protein [Uliginosibacterium sediminicola]|uniref:HDOD domain-containing protein n=1 Tax=Uliginosibacterium sediminicola TaxID=2024550 RepID=A0ABU9YXI3_9RHOO
MSAGVLITREPVINKQGAITANRLIFHAPDVATAAAALNELSADWPQGRLVFVSLGKLVPTAELLNWQAPENTLVEIPGPALQYPQTQALIAQLNASGMPLALSWYQPGAQWPADVDCRFVMADANKLPSPGPVPGLSLAWGLPDLPAFSQAVQRGYDGAAGWFFLHGVPVAKELAPSYAGIIRVLNLVREEAEVAKVEAALKQDVTLSYQLLKYINSAAFGLMVEVQSFRHAVTILGMDKLNKWLSVLLVSASRSATAPAVMQAAITRGHFMEKLGAQFFAKGELDNLFITGAFSLLHILLGTRLDAVLAQMNLPPAIGDALLRNEGSYAPLLKLAVASESFRPDALRTQTEALGLSSSEVNRVLLESVAFADRLSFS